MNLKKKKFFILKEKIEVLCHIDFFVLKIW